MIKKQQNSSKVQSFHHLTWGQDGRKQQVWENSTVPAWQSVSSKQEAIKADNNVKTADFSIKGDDSDHIF